MYQYEQLSKIQEMPTLIMAFLMYPDAERLAIRIIFM